jgi:hypothetical protein
VRNALSIAGVTVTASSDPLETAWALALIAQDTYRWSTTYEQGAARRLAVAILTGDVEKQDRAAAWIVDPQMAMLDAMGARS